MRELKRPKRAHPSRVGSPDRHHGVRPQAMTFWPDSLRMSARSATRNQSCNRPRASTNRPGLGCCSALQSGNDAASRTTKSSTKTLDPLTGQCPPSSSLHLSVRPGQSGPHVCRRMASVQSPRSASSQEERSAGVDSSAMYTPFCISRFSTMKRIRLTEKRKVPDR